MGYQAFLFCVDEKLARVVSQLFSELEFAVTPQTDPFAAIKSLMAQHYDAVVLDCENEQNASLLIKSARNSTFNQGSLAIALVEGQAGVAKAYRMGANLVLTKPINVEQAKGTLRVARGLLRRGSEAATHAAAVTPAAPAAFSPVAPTHPHVEASAAHTAPNATPQYETHYSSGTNAPAIPAPAFARSQEAPARAPAAQTKAWTALAGQAPFVQPQSADAPVSTAQTSGQPPASEQVTSKAEVRKPAVVPFVNATPRSHGAASAPAPAKEVVAPAQPARDGEGREEFPEDAPFHAPQAAFSHGAAEASAGPSFSVVTEQAGRSGGSGSQKILIGAVAVFLMIAAYFGWSKFGPSPSTPAPATTSVAATPQMPAQVPANVSSTPAPAAQVPSAPANHTTAVTAPGHTTSSVQPGHSAADASTTQAAAVSESVSQSTTTKTAPAPILVKSGAPAKTRQAQPPSQTEDVSAQPPSALGIVSPSEGSLSGVLAANAAKPTLARVRISQGVSQGLLIKQVPPKYPSNAIAMRAQGEVRIEATVDKEGRVVNPKVVSGPALLAPAALDAVRQWRYKPYYLDGQPVEIQTQITIKFKTQ